MPVVKGLVVDGQARCEHYASDTDIVAIKFHCCGVYYPCYRCHEACADHEITRWPANQLDRRVILCGACKTEMSIGAYLKAAECPDCGAAFNPGCRVHHRIYFDVLP